MRILIVFFFLNLSAESISQILPGMERDEILEYMSLSHKDFVFREPPNVNELDFIKYEHVSGDKTLLVFMTENGYCSFTRLMVDIDYLEEIIENFNREYDNTGEMKWTLTERGKKFSIDIEESEWLFTVTVRSAKEGNKQIF